MRPNFEHVNKDSLERLLPGHEALKPAPKPQTSMKIVDDAFKKQQQHELDLQNEKEKELVINPIGGDESEAILSKMTTKEEPKEEKVVTLDSQRYMAQILFNEELANSTSGASVMQKITREREGDVSIEILYEKKYDIFLPTVLVQARIIPLASLIRIVQGYFSHNKQYNLDPDQIGPDIIAEDVLQTAHILGNGYCIVRSKMLYSENLDMCAMRNKVIFKLYTSPEGYVRKADFEDFQEPKAISVILREL